MRGEVSRPISREAIGVIGLARSGGLPSRIMT